jgi:hypothetical protein
MNVARGDLYPDALSGGPHAGTEKAPILLTWTPQAATADGGSTTGVIKYASDHASTLTGGHIFGGTDAVSAAVEAQIEAAARGTGTAGGGTAVTSRPELQSVTAVSTNETQGTIYRYCFDEPVTVVNQAFFKVYSSAATPTTASSAVLDTATAGGQCVLVTFSSLQTAAQAAGQTVATVAFNAVRGNGAANDENAEGDIALGSTSSTPLAGGVTAAPDLTGVTFGGATVATTHTAVTFQFDENAFNQSTSTANYQLVLTNNNEVGCTYVSGTGTQSIVVDCATTSPVTASGVQRGTVSNGAVSDAAAGGNLNALQAADVTAEGSSAGPDLVSATLDLNATSGTVKVDRIIYTFDTTVTTGTSATAFGYYTVAGNPTVFNTTGTVTRNEGNTTQVSVDFPDTALANAVGAVVNDGAVTGFSSGLSNQQDEVPLANTGSITTTTGRTAGPDLTAVTLTQTKDQFGNVSGYVATYTFDERITSANASSLFLYLADGTRLTCATPNPVDTTTAGTTDLSVSCSVAGFGSTNAAVSTAVLGTAAAGAVVAQDGGPSNPEGAEVTTKSNF